MRTLLLMIVFVIGTVIFVTRTATLAPAQTTTPTLVENVDSLGRIPYQQFGTASCSGKEFTGLVKFSPVPAGERLVVQFVSGSQDLYTTAGTPTAVKMGFLWSGNAQAAAQGGSPQMGLESNCFAFSTLACATHFPAAHRFTANGLEQPTLAYFEAGDSPVIIMTVDPSGCTPAWLATVDAQSQVYTLSGYFVNPN